MMCGSLVETYPLDDLLPAGTVQLQLCEELYTKLALRSEGDRSEWETLENLLSHSAGKDRHDLSQNPRYVELSFLAKYQYIRPQWKLFNDNLLHVRIYLIPLDHPARPRKTPSKYPQRAMLDAQKYLISLLPSINRASLAWDNPDDQFEPFLPASVWPILCNNDVSGKTAHIYKENITLAEMFSNLPAPELHPSTFLQNVDPRTRKYYSPALTWDRPPGMKTTLYQYQIRTVASMLQREAQPDLIIDPSYITIQGVKGPPAFYLQPATMKILRGPLPRYPLLNGGILCEEMGTGKTCIILALIMATKDHLAQPGEGSWRITDTHILTELALRTFPFSTFKAARDYSYQPISSRGLPSLQEILLHYIRTSPLVLSSSDYRKIEAYPHLGQWLRNCVPFYRLTAQQFEVPRISVRRAEVKSRWRQFYLTSATLIVVPQAIVVQWNSEINKHCDTSILRVLFLDESIKSQTIPSAPRLASDYDIVLLTHERFSRYKEKEENLIRETYCRCQANHLSRIPECFCKQNECSPLMQVRWKRLVVDEGHKTGTVSNYAQRCQTLNAEHRWIVTGTPTPNLMGLGLGKPGRKNEECSGNDDDYDDDEDHPYNTNIPPSRPWTKEERNDLNILGDYVSRFFHFSPYLNRSEFTEKVVKPIVNTTGPLPGSIRVLRNIMALIMFRHPTQVIESEIPEQLPLLEEKVVKLKFHPLAANTYNVLQSVIAVNAVDSQREHQDYLFHPSSRKQLRIALENLSQTLFWKTDPEIFHLQEAILNSGIAEMHAIERHVSASDLRLVRESLLIQQEAYAADVWTAMMFNEDHVFSVRGLSEPLKEAWLKIDPIMFGDGDPYLDADRLLAMQRIMHVSPLISEEKLALLASKQCALEIQRKNFSRARNERYKNHTLVNKQYAKLTNTTHAGKDRIEAAHNADSDDDANEQFNDGTLEITSKTRVPRIILYKSVSSKVNYILRKVVKHAAKHKFLIFSSMPLSLAYLADALRLAQVQFLSYVSTGMTPRQRQSNAVTFETSQECRVLLVELKLGARGLNLISASRIIFCEPVWHGDIESQAIKRAHRIGSKCEKLKVCKTGFIVRVASTQGSGKVVTLVMEGTYEEAMVSRRRTLQNQVQQQASSFELDVSMRRVLETTTFITREHVDEGDSNVIDIPLVKEKRELFDFEEERLKIDEDTAGNTGNLEPAFKKTKRVHYAE